MRELPPDLARGVEEIDGRGLSRDPGARRLPHACLLRRRPGERVLAPCGRSLVRGAPRRRRRHPLDRTGDPRGRRGRADPRSRCSTAAWMRAHGTTTFEGKSGYGLDHDTELAQLRAVRAAGGVPTWLGAHTVPPEFDDADAYVDFLLAEVLPEAAALAEAADVFLERGSFDADAGAALPRGLPRRGARACGLHGDQFTESGAIELAIELGRALGRPPRGDRARRRCPARRERRHGRAPAGERAVPRAADAPGPRARRRRRARRARDRLQPGQRLLRQPAARPLARVHPAEARARGGARRGDRERRPRARSRRPIGRLSAGFAADVVLLDAAGLAACRLPPRGRRRPHRGRRRGGRVPRTA